MRDFLDSREKKLLENLAELEASKKNTLDSQERELLQFLEELSASVQFAEALSQDGTNVDLLVCQKYLLERLGTLGLSDVPPKLLELSASSKVSFFSHKEPLLKHIEEFGLVESNEASSLSTISREAITTFPASKSYSFTILAVDKRGERLKFGRDHFVPSAIDEKTQEVLFVVCSFVCFSLSFLAIGLFVFRSTKLLWKT